MAMFEKFYGMYKIEKKLARLLNAVVSKKEEDVMCMVKLTGTHMIATDGSQILRFEIEPEAGLKPGVYVLAGNILVPVKNKVLEERYPDVDPPLDRANFSKTAKLDMSRHPLVAMGHAIADFHCVIDLDAFHKVFKLLSQFDSEFVRLLGFEKKEEAKVQGLKTEFLVEADGKRFSMPCVIEYMVMPLELEKEDFLKVDREPMLWDLKEAG